MKADACLQQLQLTLAQLPETELRKILVDYGDYICDAAADENNESRLLDALSEQNRISLAAFIRQRAARRGVEYLAPRAAAFLAAVATSLAAYWLYLQ